MAFKALLKKCTPLLGRGLLIRNMRNHEAVSQFHSSCRRKEEFSIQDTKDFEERVLTVTGKLTIIDFHASWCGPCKLLTPRITKALEKVGDKVNLAKVDVDVNTELAMEYKVSSVPAVFFHKDGNIVDKFVGAIEQDRIEHYIEKHM